MAESTFNGYLGPEFQTKVVWQLLTEPEFAENIIEQLSSAYFDDLTLKRLFAVMNEFYKDFEKVPNLQNQSIYHAIKQYNISGDSTDEEILSSVVEKIKNWNDSVLNGQIKPDSEYIQKEVYNFIKQQEYVKLANYILEEVGTGNAKADKTNLAVEEKVKKIAEIGDDEDYGDDVMDDIDDTLVKDYRQPIPTGIDVIDKLMGGGLGKGEMGIVLAPSGVGKSTILTKIANTAYDVGKHVLQIIFEDTKKSIKRKHYAIWSDIGLSEIDNNTETVRQRVDDYKDNKKLKSRLIIKRFSQDDTTLPDIRRWIDRYQKKFDIKFEIIVLDYLDCLEPHKKSADITAAELHIVKAFESMAGEMDIPCWTALQTNRSGFNSEYVDASQMGGNIKRAQKTHFLMSVAKTQEQKLCGQANIQILKARFVQDGHVFTDCIFNNNSMEIRVTDDLPNRKRKVEIEHGDEVSEEDLTKKLNQIKSDEATKQIHKEIKTEIDSPYAKIADIPSIDSENLFKSLQHKKEASKQEKEGYSNLLAKMADTQGLIKKEVIK